MSLRYDHPMRVLGVTALLFLVACNQKPQATQIKHQETLNALNPNIAYVLSTYEDAWNTTLKVVQYDFLLPIEIQNQQEGFFTTVMIKEYDADPPRRYRLSGDLSSNNQETMIKLYKSEQVRRDDGTWQTRLSNLALEKKIVDTIQNTLEKP